MIWFGLNQSGVFKNRMPPKQNNAINSLFTRIIKVAGTNMLVNKRMMENSLYAVCCEMRIRILSAW